jgi:ubiquinone/menaquinone biosynthesis C-methylase UbiE
MKHHYQSPTSWQKVGRWYDKNLGIKGDYFHSKIIMPKVIKLLDLKPGNSVLDLGCGQGILARYIIKDVDYYGVDIAADLIESAKKKTFNKRCQFLRSDITKPLIINRKFSHAAIILTLQNVFEPGEVIKNASQYLNDSGKLVIVLNHPCFRIPRQSSWQIDEQNKLQYRRINRYLSSLKIPITMNPGSRQHKNITWSYHFPLSILSQDLYKAGFSIELMEEWSSDKKSEGKAARMENRGREEFPLFLAISAKKK